MHAGGIWEGDILVADIEELETMDASEIYSERLNVKEVIFPKQGEFIFQSQNPGRRSGPENIHLDTGTPQFEEKVTEIFLENQKGSLPPPQGSLPDVGEAINDFWSMSGNFIYRHHIEPKVKLYSPRDESFPMPLKYIDVSRTTCSNLDVEQEKRIDDYWNVDGSRDLSDSWTGFTQFILLEETPPDGYMWSSGKINEKTADIQARPSMAKTLRENGKECQAEGEAKVVT